MLTYLVAAAGLIVAPSLMVAAPGLASLAQSAPVQHLFRKQADSPEPGSAAWRATFPTPYQIPTQVPEAWTKKFEEVKAQGLIPDLPVAILDASGFPRYPNDATTGRAAATCSHTHTGCVDADDYEVAPDGVYALAFDDGPQPASVELYDFLAKNNLAATHFMIGSNIVSYLDVFNQAFTRTDGEIAVHTWSHRFGITLTNEQLVAEIGWCMQAIHDLTGGRVPSAIRPPYGDADARTKAIMKHVFGLRVVFWNSDSEDWCLNVPSGRNTTACPGVVGSDADVADRFEEFIDKPKSPGLMVLQHEHVPRGISVFKEAYPKLVAANWIVNAIAEGCGFPPYQNADGNDGDVTPMDIVEGVTATESSTSSTASRARSTPTSSASTADQSSTARTPVSSGAAVSASPNGDTSAALPAKLNARSLAALAFAAAVGVLLL